MARSFLGYFGQHLYQSAGLIGTLAGTIAAFAYAKDYVWIHLTFFLIFAAAALLFCRQMYADAETARRAAEGERQRRRDAEARAEQEKQKVRELVESGQRQRAEAQANIKNLVAEALEGYQGIQVERVSAQVMRETLARLAYVKRMRLFTQSLAKPPEVRKIEPFAGKLYVTVRLDAPALKHLRVGDLFLLLEAAPSGAQAEVALLRLNQPPNPPRRSAHFLVEEVFGDRAEPLERLARTDDLEALQLHRLTPAVDVTRFRNLHIEDAIQVIQLLAAESRMASFRGEYP